MTSDLFVPAQVADLEQFVRAGVLGATEINVACTFASATGDSSFEVMLAAALAVRAPLHGSVCVDLTTIRDTVVSTVESNAHLATAQSDGDRTEDDDEGRAEDLLNGDGGEQPDLLALRWPDPTSWMDRVNRSPLVLHTDRIEGQLSGSGGGDVDGMLRPLVSEGGLLYLSRYWSLERYVAADLRERASLCAAGDESRSGGATASDVAAASAEIRRLFDVAAGAERLVDNAQVAASIAAVERDFVVISGGPGTGKTTTVARFLAGLVTGMEGDGTDHRIALAAPTGKAAARMTEAIRHAIGSMGSSLSESVVERLDELDAITIHRLLGRAPGGGFRHGPGDPLPHDILIVDEVSMVSLSLMAHLLAAVRRGAKVILVGDPYQLASVEAGSVLGDIVGTGVTVCSDTGGDGARHGSEPAPPPAVAESVMTLGTVHRQGHDSGILTLANLIRMGRTDEVMAFLDSNPGDVIWIDAADARQRPRLDQLKTELTEAALSSVGSARAGSINDALESISRVKVLCALHRGNWGVESWNDLIEGELRSHGVIGQGRSYSGRPVMVTENDYLNEVFNGDVGVAVRHDDRHQVWFRRGSGNHMVEEVRLDRSVTQWAMSIHKSQGSEFPHAVVALPAPPSRILTRELLYTAVTRAKDRLTIVSGEAAIRLAIERRVARASGLHQRLCNPEDKN